MTTPNTPGDVIARATQRLATQRQETRTRAEALQAQREGTASPEPVPGQEGAP